MIVDHQCHWYPREFFEFLSGRTQFPRATRAAAGAYVFELSEGGWVAEVPRHFVELDDQLEDMERNGVEVGVISPNMLGEIVWSDASEGRDAFMLLNGALAEAQRRHPRHVVGLAMLPMYDSELAVEVLDHAIGELDLRGVCVLSNVAGGSIATDATLPIYRRIDELGVPVYLHPSANSMLHDRALIFPIEGGVTWMFETTAAALSLIYSGTLDECEHLQIVHHHLGGMLPYVIGRLDQIMAHREEIAEQVKLVPGATKHPLRTYLRERFYVDTVNFTPGAMELAAECYGADRLLFATDYPWVRREEARSWVEERYPPALRDAVLGRNAVDQLPLPEEV